MPNDSLREQIMQAIVAKLETITISNGYRTTVASVQRYRQGGQIKADLPSIFVAEGHDKVDQALLSGNGDLVHRHLELGIVCWLRQERDDTRAADKICNALRADVQALVAANYSWGDLAIDTTEVASYEIEAEEGGADLGFGLEYDLAYRHRRTDPSIGG